MMFYFGKRGISVEVNVFIMKIGDVFHKKVYLVALEKTDQGMLDTLSIAKVVLDEFKLDYPHITAIRIKSDNAGISSNLYIILYCITNNKILGNYHANGVCETMHTIAKNVGINLTQYIYNEAQCVSITINFT